jgi:hypothetical protein
VAPSRHGAPAAGYTAGTIRAELTRVRQSLRIIEEALSELDEDRASAHAARARPERYLRVLLAVYELGGRHGVDAEGLAAIGQEHGYDRRGLGGFFTGARAPLRRSGSRVRLSASGAQLLDDYLARTDP